MDSSIFAAETPQRKRRPSRTEPDLEAAMVELLELRERVKTAEIAAQQLGSAQNPAQRRRQVAPKLTR